MRVGLVCPYSWDVPGGVRTHVADLAAALVDHGHEVSVMAPAEDPKELPPDVVDGGRPIAIRYNGSVARLSIGVKATRRVRAWIREGHFDVLHVHEPMAPSLSMLALWVARGPIVATWHSSHDRSRVLSAGYYVGQTVMEKVRGRIAVSENARRTLVNHLGGDAVLIPNGVRVAAYRSPERLPGVDPDRPAILFLGRMDEPRKGLAVLRAALPRIVAAIPDIQVLVAGPGNEDEQRELLPPAVTGNVRFLGRISDEDKARALRSVDAYVAPHTGGESFGIVLVEAMSAQAPVIASDLLAFRNVLEDGRCGRLFPNQDSAALADAVIQLIADPDLRSAYVAEGDRRVRDFDWDRVVDEVIAVYDSVHMPGEKVTEDLRGQVVGRLSRRGTS
ncbi:MAG: glycosyltransferase [Actinomycetales bacterium]|nr:glycosyltransferase [Actinomycetales bacterium]